MRLLNVPHYHQNNQNDCQSACAAMVIDYIDGVYDNDAAARFEPLLESFAFGFRTAAGEVPPAITGLVAASIAGPNRPVHFYTTNPTLADEAGLQFLIQPPWSFTQQDVVDFAAHAAKAFAQAQGTKYLTTEARGITEDEVLEAVKAHRPVVMLVDDGFLRGVDQLIQHVYVVTGLNDTNIWLQDPDSGSAIHRCLSKQKFFAAYRKTGTDCDAYVIG